MKLSDKLSKDVEAKTPPFCAPQVSSKTSSQILKGCAAVMLPPIQLSHCRSSGPRETAPRAFASTGGGIVGRSRQCLRASANFV